MKRHRVLLIVESSLAFGRRLLSGIRQYLLEQPGWSVQLDLRELIVPEPAWLEGWDGDGIICRSTTPAMAKMLKTLQIPTVDLTDIYGDQGLPFIWNDDPAIGRLAAEHLLERGFKRFGFCGFSDHAWSAGRRDGFTKAVQASGYDCDVYESDWSDAREMGWDLQQEEISRWLRDVPKPVGIMACNDLRGQHILDACSQMDLGAPENVAVIGVDDDQMLCHFCDPPLTSIIPNAVQIGYEAARMLDGLMQGTVPQTTGMRIEPIGVATRQSTDVLAIDDPLVATAVRFIRENACRGVTVSDVLDAVPLSRSVLERRFRHYLNRSPQGEIRNVQLKRAKQLLSESELSIEEIARLIGVKHAEYLSVLFKREVGQTPGEYRRKHPHVGG